MSAISLVFSYKLLVFITCTCNVFFRFLNIPMAATKTMSNPRGFSFRLRLVRIIYNKIVFIYAWNCKLDIIVFDSNRLKYSYPEKHSSHVSINRTLHRNGIQVKNTFNVSSLRCESRNPRISLSLYRILWLCLVL